MYSIVALYTTLKRLTSSPRKVLQELQEYTSQSFYIGYIEALNPLANSRTNDRQLPENKLEEILRQKVLSHLCGT